MNKNKLYAAGTAVFLLAAAPQTVEAKYRFSGGYWSVMKNPAASSGV